MRAFRALTLVALALTGFPLAGSRAVAAPLALSPCLIEHPLRLTVLPADCGVLSVAENPRAPQGRRIGIYVARVAAVSRRKQADALFVLAGGPGQAAGAFYASVAGAFARIHRERDIVLVDQRGTGHSNALTCAADEERLYRVSDAEVARLMQDCLEALRTRADPAFYTTSVAVGDLEQVRVALGYERIDLYGASYGTRVAQQYLRRYPERVRALILDGVVPPTLAIGPDVAGDAENAVRAILARCAADAACSARFGTPLKDYEAVRADVGRRTLHLTVPDPVSAQPRALEFGREELATVLRLSGYSADYAALLPLFLHGAAGGEYAPMAAQFLLLQRSFDTLALGMHNSVVCAEDVPFWNLRALDRAALQATFMGEGQVSALSALCAIWPHGPVDADLHTPLKSDVPALLLSGGDDPVTPPRYARAAAQGFSQARELTLPGFGHGQLTAPCMDRVLAQFLERGTTQALDTGCLANARPMAFFLSVNGPAP
jgi:pimeloyl-ACP methyl ester carboxylesterase